MGKDRENWCYERAVTGERGATAQFSRSRVSYFPLACFRNLPTYLRAWVPENIMRIFRFGLGFGKIFIVTCASPLVTSVFSASFDRRTRQKTAGTQSNVSKSLAHVNLGKAAHSRKYWNSITCGHLSHITCSVSICTLLFWGKHGLTDSTHLRFLQLPSVHEVFGCSYRKKTNLSITATSWMSLLNWRGRYFYLRFL